MNLLITGSSGLLGSSLCKDLTAHGYTVIGYDRENHGYKLPNYFFEEGDLRDFPRLVSVMRKYEIDSILHCGGISHPKTGECSPYSLVQINITGTLNIFEAAKLFNVKKVIYLSSGAVYGKNQLIKTAEGDPLNPTSFYGISKLTGEQIASVYMEKEGIETISLRFAFVYGPDRKMPDPIKSLLEQAIKGIDIKLEKGSDQEIEYIYIKDAVRAIKKAMKSSTITSRILNVGSGVNTSIKEVIQVIKKLYPEVTIEVGPGDFGYDTIGAFDCSRAERELGFKIEYRLEDGIRDYARFLEDKIKNYMRRGMNETPK
ncbi:NAD(P)-dependent oxidoreductase [Alkalihalobacillus oceani]|uniref:NAD(P)-dependent oxidoreductase n=1 Tax=Halalkalibacter oceani TaxID=1653776 RepID=A0A9X2DLX5_9BACI|nr:NAD(P)-dependent oxidoreductase [Halalkalibacter oceani]MCM3712994.1 NAD(P)-dependent oxidoreductase [Halalkalibacter oceani]